MTNLDHLSNLTAAGTVIDLRNNDSLTDISGLSNLTTFLNSESQVILDLKDYDGKLASDSYLCNWGISYLTIWDGETYREASTLDDKSIICDQ